MNLEEMVVKRWANFAEAHHGLGAIFAKLRVLFMQSNFDGGPEIRDFPV
jgi:hypothetical protein